MSADNGFIIRNNKEGKFVLQHYFASDDTYPDVEKEAGFKFNTLEEAIVYYQELDSGEYSTEYGLTVSINNPKDRESTTMIETQKYARKPFNVDAVQVTLDNMEEVAKWCQGEVRTEPGQPEADNVPYIHVRVHRPLNERQTKAYIGDWVLYAGTGYKVYTSKAFNNAFEVDPNALQELRTTSNVFKEEQPSADEVGQPVKS